MEKRSLLDSCFPRADVEIEVVSEDGSTQTATVMVRGLSRGEYMTWGGTAGESPTVETAKRSEIYLLTHGMLEPKLSEDEAERLYESAPSSILSPIIAKIVDLSGIRRESAKEAYKSI